MEVLSLQNTFSTAFGLFRLRVPKDTLLQCCLNILTFLRIPLLLSTSPHLRMIFLKKKNKNPKQQTNLIEEKDQEERRWQTRWKKALTRMPLVPTQVWAPTSSPSEPCQCCGCGHPSQAAHVSWLRGKEALRNPYPAPSSAVKKEGNFVTLKAGGQIRSHSALKLEE